MPPDEALQRVRQEGGEYADLGPGSDPVKWQRAAETYYRPAALDYFEDMDAIGTTERPGAAKIRLGPEEVKGRNAWVMWTGGNEAWWDWLARYGYGSIDLLKLIDDRNRETRFARTGLVNEPGTRPPTQEETDEAQGVRYTRPVTEPTPGYDVHVEYRKDHGPDWVRPNPKVYGYPSGVVGLRLFPNPEFTEEAKQRWIANLDKYYSDTPEGRRYAAHPDTIRPFRVGMSCGFCHIAPHPLKPPADPEFPKWENLSNNVGNQFMRMRASFSNTLRPENYLYHVFDAMQPGAVDTSGYPSDNNNNANTVNSFYGLRGRLARAAVTPLETLSQDSLDYVRDFTSEGGTNPKHLPRVLLDGSDSVGVHIALARVYLNIGTHHQQWIRTINPLLGFSEQKPFKLQDVAGNSLYWHAIRIRVPALVSFFVAATDPMRLKDVTLPVKDGGAGEQERKTLMERHLRGTGLPWYSESSRQQQGTPPLVGGAGDYKVGRRVFARGCIACHSSVQPGDLLALEQKLDAGKDVDAAADPDKLPQNVFADGDSAPALPPLGDLPPAQGMKTRAEWDALTAKALAGRRGLRLTNEDRIRLARGDGMLPPAYAKWARQAVEQREFWEHQDPVWDENGNPVLDPNGRQRQVTIYNYLSIDERLPVNVVGTNSGRATATNSLSGHVWEDFASQTYKELGEVGRIEYKDPFSGATRYFSPPGNGPGYYRVPTLISIWATAPFLHNNALGNFNNDPSVPGRLAAFEDATKRLLWPDRRERPGEVAYWSGSGAATSVYDAWYPGKKADSAVPAPARPGPLDQAAAAARRDRDGGWVWRTTAESWLMFDAPHVPMLVGGVVGISRYQMQLLAWVPALALLVLGIAVLLAGAAGPGQRSLLRRVSWVERLFATVRWPLAFGGLVLAGVSVHLVLNRFWPAVELLDVGTGGAIPAFRLQAILFPVVLFGSVGLLAGLPWLPEGRGRTFASRTLGALCLVLAVLTALGVGRTLSGVGASVKIGPIPEGIPVNVLANIDPLAPKGARLEALDALVQFLNTHRKAAETDHTEEAKTRRREEFEQKVAPALMRASKCPDFALDRGHDFAFLRNLTDSEKRELTALLKTF